MMADRIVDRAFVLVGVISLCTSLVFYLLLTTMALYAVERFGVSDTVAGFCSTAFILGAVLSRASATTLMRLAGRRHVIIIGGIVSVVGALLTPLAAEAWQLIAIRACHGAAFGAVSTLTVSGILSAVPAGRRAEAAGYLGIASTVATAIGPLLAVTLVAGDGYAGLFTAAVVFTVIAALVSLVVELPDGRDERRPTSSRARINRPLGELTVVIALIGVAYSGIIAYLAAHATALDAAWSIGAYFGLHAGFAMIGRLLIGRVQDRFGDNVVVYPVLVAFAVNLLLLALATDATLIIVAGVFMGIGFGMFLPTMQAAAARLVPAAGMNTAVAAVFLSVDLGVGVGPLLLGSVVSAAGFSGMYGVLSGVVVIAGVFYALTHGRRAGRRPSPGGSP